MIFWWLNNEVFKLSWMSKCLKNVGKIGNKKR